MKGIYHVVVQNRYLKYEFDIRRNLTIIQGNSATGKTTLVEMIRESNLNENSGVMISCKCLDVYQKIGHWIICWANMLQNHITQISQVCFTMQVL